MRNKLNKGGCCKVCYQLVEGHASQQSIQPKGALTDARARCPEAAPLDHPGPHDCQRGTPCTCSKALGAWSSQGRVYGWHAGAPCAAAPRSAALTCWGRRALPRPPFPGGRKRRHSQAVCGQDALHQRAQRGAAPHLQQQRAHRACRAAQLRAGSGGASEHFTLGPAWQCRRACGTRQGLVEH